MEIENQEVIVKSYSRDEEEEKRESGFQMKDHNCAICFGIMFEPTTLPCAHSFCLECAKAIFKVKYSLKCPMCRTPLPPQSCLSVDARLRGKLETELPQEFGEFEAIREAQKEIERNNIKVTLQIGNTH